MVNITNGKTIILVPSGAFKEIYKKQGWRVAGTEDVEAANNHVEEIKIEPIVDTSVENENALKDLIDDEEEIGNDEEELSLDEKPLKEMSLEELKEYAKMNNINIKGLSERKEIRKAIKEAMNN